MECDQNDDFFDHIQFLNFPSSTPTPTGFMRIGIGNGRVSFIRLPKISSPITINKKDESPRIFIHDEIKSVPDDWYPPPPDCNDLSEKDKQFINQCWLSYIEQNE